MVSLYLSGPGPEPAAESAVSMPFSPHIKNFGWAKTRLHLYTGTTWRVLSELNRGSGATGAVRFIIMRRLLLGCEAVNWATVGSGACTCCFHSHYLPFIAHRVAAG